MGHMDFILQTNIEVDGKQLHIVRHLKNNKLVAQILDLGVHDSPNHEYIAYIIIGSKSTLRSWDLILELMYPVVVAENGKGVVYKYKKHIK
jgi:hypothetical protein